MPVPCLSYSQGNNKIAYNLLAAKSAFPQFPGQHMCYIGGLHNIDFSATLSVGVGFFQVNCMGISRY
jgi:hypothetical protein